MTQLADAAQKDCLLGDQNKYPCFALILGLETQLKHSDEEKEDTKSRLEKLQSSIEVI